MTITADTKTRLIDLLSRVTLEKGGDYPFSRAVEEAKASGIKFKHEWHQDTILYDAVWEHPWITEYNASLTQQQILMSWFFTLYELKAKHTSLRGAPRLVLIVGRLGNTAIYLIQETT